MSLEHGDCRPDMVERHPPEAFICHAFAKGGTDIRTVQELLGHSDVSPIMIYTHVLKVAASGTASPLDALSSLM